MIFFFSSTELSIYLVAVCMEKLPQHENYDGKFLDVLVICVKNKSPHEIYQQVNMTGDGLKTMNAGLKFRSVVAVERHKALKLEASTVMIEVHPDWLKTSPTLMTCGAF